MVNIGTMLGPLTRLMRLWSFAGRVIILIGGILLGVMLGIFLGRVLRIVIMLVCLMIACR